MLSPRSFRTTELVKEFCRQGHEVTLVTSYNSEDHDLLLQEYGFKIIDFGKLRFPKINAGGGEIFNIFQRGLRKLLLEFFQYPNIEVLFKVKKILKQLSGFDLMISVATPHPTHWGAALAWNINRPIAKTWIADCGDPFMLIPYGNETRPIYFKYLEKSWCKKANYITIPNIAMRKNFYPEFKDKFHEITQGFKFEETQKYLKPYEPNEIPTFVFAGNFIPGIRDPKELLEILIEQEQDFHFHIFTRSKNLVQSYLERSKGRIIIHDYIPRPALIAFLSKADFLVNIGYDPTLQLPSKMIDYYLTGRPILNLPSKNMNKELILKFLNGDYSEKFVNPDIDQYRIENVCKKFLELA